MRHTLGVDLELRAALKTVDAAELGRRVKAARLAKQLTQAEVAGESVSVAYVSRIESGLRRPDPELLEAMASRLGATPEALVLGITRDEAGELRLELDYAELALATGDGHGALARSRAVLDTLSAGSEALAPLTRRARYVEAHALETTGAVENAILKLESFTATPSNDLPWLRSCIGLCRCYRETGDLARSVATGERALEALAASELADSTDAIKLNLTLAMAYFEQGDVAYAIRICLRSIDRAEQLRLPQALAAAYWNASIFQSKSGSLHDAIELARKALFIFEQGEDARNLARLRAQLGVLQLRATPPEITEAEENLTRAAQEMAWTSASPTDLARTDLSLARVAYLKGHLEAALTATTHIADQMNDAAPLLAAEAHALTGQVQARQGDTVAAAKSYHQAVLTLTACGADRGAAQLWFDLGALLDQVGDTEAARDAYLRAAASTGLTSRVSASHMADL